MFALSPEIIKDKIGKRTEKNGADKRAIIGGIGQGRIWEEKF